jgi:hypothetical protein
MLGDLDDHTARGRRGDERLQSARDDQLRREALTAR